MKRRKKYLNKKWRKYKNFTPPPQLLVRAKTIEKNRALPKYTVVLSLHILLVWSDLHVSWFSDDHPLSSFSCLSFSCNKSQMFCPCCPFFGCRAYYYSNTGSSKNPNLDSWCNFWFLFTSGCFQSLNLTSSETFQKVESKFLKQIQEKDICKLI